MIRSAALTVESRWAIRMLVVFCRISSSPCWICHSVNGSMLAVASSRMKIAGLLHQHPHQGDQLALPHREPPAALAHLGLQPLRQRFQPLALPDLAGQGEDLLIG